MKIPKNCENSFILKIPPNSLKIWKLRKFPKILQNPKSTNDIQDFWIFSKYEFSRIKWDITQHGTWAIKITLFENEKKCLTPTFRKFDVVDVWIFVLKIFYLTIFLTVCYLKFVNLKILLLTFWRENSNIFTFTSHAML